MSLASLSIFCDDISNLQVDAARPALLFRLHDFPTVLLRPAEQCPVTSGQSLVFARGKSCLLEWPSGNKTAGTIKLQLLLVDLLEPPGSRSGSVAAGKGVLLGRAVCEVSFSGVASPFTADTLTMRDLAGNKVAVVRTRHRLAALGAALIPHLVQSLRTQPLRAAEGDAAGVVDASLEPRAASRPVDVITEPAMVEPLPKVLVAGTSAAAQEQAPSPHQ